jgi:hypothetical protein
MSHWARRPSEDIFATQDWGVRRSLTTTAARARQERRAHWPLLLVQPRGQGTVGLSRLKAKRLRSAFEIRTALASHGHRAFWVTPSAAALRLLLSVLPSRLPGDQRLLSLAKDKGDRQALLHALFRFVVSKEEGVRLLPIGQLAEALNFFPRADRFIGTAPARDDKTVILYRGNLEALVVPLAWFEAQPGSLRPALSEVAVTDFGQTICLGKHEASAAHILHKFDEQYRQRTKHQRNAADRTLGGILRRLRLERGLRQRDFPGVTGKEIARIERSEVKKPRLRTLARIAKRLGIRVQEISRY